MINVYSKGIRYTNFVEVSQAQAIPGTPQVTYPTRKMIHSLSSPSSQYLAYHPRRSSLYSYLSIKIMISMAPLTREPMG